MQIYSSASKGANQNDLAQKSKSLLVHGGIRQWLCDLQMCTIDCHIVWWLVAVLPNRYRTPLGVCHCDGNAVYLANGRTSSAVAPASGALVLVLQLEQVQMWLCQ